MAQLHRRIAAKKLIRNKRNALNAKTKERKAVIKAFLSVVDTCSPFSFTSSALEPLNSLNLDWLSDILESTDSLNHTAWPSLRSTLFISSEQYPDLEELELRSRLHTYIGLTYSDRQTNSTDSSTSSSFAEKTTFINHSTGSPFSGSRYALRSTLHDGVGPTDSHTSSLFSHADLTLSTNGYHRQSLRSAARSMVYDIRNYNASNMYGPYQPQDADSAEQYHVYAPPSKPHWEINWRHVEALMMVVAWNVEDEQALGVAGFEPPMGLESLRPWGATAFKPLSGSSHPGDWAGVEGRWRRIVCFMDYRDFFAFNVCISQAIMRLKLITCFQFTHAARDDDTGPRDTSVFEDEDFAEAMRVLTVDLHVTSIEPISTPIPSSSSSSAPLSFHRPRINFEGVSEGGTPNESNVVGFVESNPNTGDIRWRLVSVYHGEERWASEGVQVGGVGSAMGVIGNWSGVHHAEGDPAGPFWFWKVGERRGA